MISIERHLFISFCVLIFIWRKKEHTNEKNEKKETSLKRRRAQITSKRDWFFNNRFI